MVRELELQRYSLGVLNLEIRDMAFSLTVSSAKSTCPHSQLVLTVLTFLPADRLQFLFLIMTFCHRALAYPCRQVSKQWKATHQSEVTQVLQGRVDVLEPIRRRSYLYLLVGVKSKDQVSELVFSWCRKR
jgi:hypothetical protein